MPFRIVPIVEGQGEVLAVPELFRRIIAELDFGVSIEVGRPVRQPRDKVLKNGELQRALGLAANEIGQEGAVFILLDSDDDCPAEAGPHLLAQARAIRADLRIAVVLAQREFEAWFLASASSLKGLRALSNDIETHQVPESVRGCKEWLETWMPAASKYSPSADQPLLLEYSTCRSLDRTRPHSINFGGSSRGSANMRSRSRTNLSPPSLTPKTPSRRGSSSASLGRPGGFCGRR
jgi:hypothetical protein